MKNNPPGPIPRMIVVANGKGGVGKTSLSSNLAGLFAAGGLRTLVVDLDPQGNLARDLGYERSDGSELLAAVISGGEAPIIHSAGGREFLDVVPGGIEFEDVIPMAQSRSRRSETTSLASMLWSVLAPVADDYDVILVDTPPRDKEIIDAAFTIGHSVIIPTRSDDASFDGLELVARRFAIAREVNPTLRLAGVVLFGVGSRSEQIARYVRETIEAILEGVAPVFNTRIRHMESAARDQRRLGLLIHELEAHSSKAQAARFQALRSGTAGPDMYSRNPQGLAEDYEHLAAEVLARQKQLEEEYV